MSSPDAQTAGEQIKAQLEQYQKTFEQSVVDQFRQIAQDAELLRARNQGLYAQVNAVLAPDTGAPEDPNAYGVFRNPITRTLMVLSNVKRLNGMKPLFQGTFSACTAFINEWVRVPKMESPRQILFPEHGSLELDFDDPDIQGVGDLNMQLQGGILTIRAVRKEKHHE